MSSLHYVMKFLANFFHILPKVPGIKGDHIRFNVDKRFVSCDNHKPPSRGAIRKEIRILLISVGLKRYKDCTVGL